jgi:hypothetical protein
VPDRDAYFWGVRFERDGKYLGVAVAMIDGLTFLRAPDEEPERTVWFNASVKVVADRLAQAMQEGTLRDDWSIDSLTFMLTGEELSGKASTGGKGDAYQHGEVVAEVDA